MTTYKIKATGTETYEYYYTVEADSEKEAMDIVICGDTTEREEPVMECIDFEMDWDQAEITKVDKVLAKVNNVEVLIIGGNLCISSNKPYPEYVKIPIDDGKLVLLNKENVSKMSFIVDTNTKHGSVCFPATLFFKQVEDAVCRNMQDECKWNGTVSFWIRSDESQKVITAIYEYFKDELDKVNLEAVQYVKELDKEALDVWKDEYENPEDYEPAKLDWTDSDVIDDFAEWAFSTRANALTREEIFEIMKDKMLKQRKEASNEVK